MPNTNRNFSCQKNYYFIGFVLFYLFSFQNVFSATCSEGERNGYVLSSNFYSAPYDRRICNSFSQCAELDHKLYTEEVTVSNEYFGKFKGVSPWGNDTLLLRYSSWLINGASDGHGGSTDREIEVSVILNDICIPNKYILIAYEEPASCATNKNNALEKVGNPCNPANGNKLQTEFDYFSTNHSLSFGRLYRSQGVFPTDNQFIHNWQHNYSSSLDTSNSLDVSFGDTISSEYNNPGEACSNGLAEFQGNGLWGGSLTGAISEQLNDNTCIIKRNSKTVASFTIVRVPANSDTAQIPPILNPDITHKLTRANGQSYLFEKINNQWKSKLNPDITLKKNGTQWLFTDELKNLETYNESGQLISITPKDGRTTTLSYNITSVAGGDDDNSTLDKVTDPTGHTLTFTYTNTTEIPRLAKVTTPDGDIQYSYDNITNNLTTVTYPDNTSKTYHYEDNRFPHHLTGITDEKGIRFATWSYDESGKAISSEHAGSAEKVILAYNADGTTTVNGILGDLRTYHFTVERGARRVSQITGDQCRTCGNGFMKTRTYDANGFLNGYTDWNGNQTTIINNARGLPTSQTDAVGTPQERTTTTVWHATLNLPLSITEPKRKTTFTYTSSGQLLTRTLIDLATNESRITSYTYHPAGTNGAGLIATVDGPRTDVNDITNYAYNAQGDLTTITNPLGHVTQITAHDASGRP